MCNVNTKGKYGRNLLANVGSRKKLCKSTYFDFAGKKHSVSDNELMFFIICSPIGLIADIA